MRQVTKLATGAGIRYESPAYGWPEGCYFLKGTKVGPTDDILKLMDLGRECEDEWGRDHGNGWLLSHPLKKLYQFQQYHLLQGGDCASTTKKCEVKVKSKSPEKPKSKYPVGTSVSKVFRDEDTGTERPFSGSVTQYDASAKLYSIKYEDGDEEELDEGGLSKIIS